MTACRVFFSFLLIIVHAAFSPSNAQESTVLAVALSVMDDAYGFGESDLEALAIGEAVKNCTKMAARAGDTKPRCSGYINRGGDRCVAVYKKTFANSEDEFDYAFARNAASISAEVRWSCSLDRKANSCVIVERRCI